MPQRYDVVLTQDTRSPLDSRGLAQFLAKDGRFLLPVLDLIETAEVVIDDLIDVMGRAAIEAVLLMSAAQVAGPRQQGKKAERDIAYHGSLAARVALRERQLRADRCCDGRAGRRARVPQRRIRRSHSGPPRLCVQSGGIRPGLQRRVRNAGEQ
jgi:hypothetical protein